MQEVQGVPAWHVRTLAGKLVFSRRKDGPRMHLQDLLAERLGAWGWGPLCFANFWGTGIEWDWGFSGIWDLKGCNKPSYSQQQIRFEWNRTGDIVGISPDLFGTVIKLCYLVAHPSWQVDNS